jgi:hypothetical protein
MLSLGLVNNKTNRFKSVSRLVAAGCKSTADLFKPEFMPYSTKLTRLYAKYHRLLQKDVSPEEADRLLVRLPLHSILLKI